MMFCLAQVIREQTKQKAEESLIMLEVQSTQAEIVQKQKEGLSLAMLIEEKNRAEVVRAKSQVYIASPCLPIFFHMSDFRA